MNLFCFQVTPQIIGQMVMIDPTTLKKDWLIDMTAQHGTARNSTAQPSQVQEPTWQGMQES